MSAAFEPITGRYLNLTLLGKPQRLLLRGSRQRDSPALPPHRGLRCPAVPRTDERRPRITDHFRVIAFDMPWHGKSSPPEGWQRRGVSAYPSRDYMSMILEVSVMRCARQAGRDGLLDRRDASCCTLRACIPERFRALIGLECAAHQPTVLRYCRGCTGLTCMAASLRRRDVGTDRAATPRQSTAGRRCGTTCRAARVSSKAICSSTRVTATSATAGRDRHREVPALPPDRRVRFLLHARRTRSPPRSTSRCARVTVMKGLGHFPMSENPEPFIGYLLPVLDRDPRINLADEDRDLQHQQRQQAARQPARLAARRRSPTSCACRS